MGCTDEATVVGGSGPQASHPGVKNKTLRLPVTIHPGATAYRPTLVDEAAWPNTEAISPLPRAGLVDTPTTRLATPSDPHPPPPRLSPVPSSIHPHILNENGDGGNYIWHYFIFYVWKRYISALCWKFVSSTRSGARLSFTMLVFMGRLSQLCRKECI